MSKLEGFCVGLVLLALVAACLYFGGEHHGSTEEKAAVLKTGESARSAAEKTTVNWQAAALAALKARDDDRTILNNTHFESSVVTPAIVPGRMLKHSPVTRVPTNTATAARATATPGGCPENLVQSTSDELQREFDAAKRYDELALDYKELYDSWPQSSPTAAHH